MTVEIKKPTIPGLASGSFVRGPSDDVAAVDVYSIGKEALGLKGKAGNPFTSVKDLTIEANKVLDNFINDNTSLANWLDKSKTGLGLKIDESELTKRIVGASSEFKGAFSELTESMRTEARIELSKDTLGTINAGINDVQSLVAASKITDARALGNFFNKYTKTNKFKTEDTGAVSSILTGVVVKSQELGITDMYTSLLETIESNAILNMLTKALIPIAIARTFPDLLKQISSGPYSTLLNVMAPDFSKTLSQTFSLKGGNTRPITTFEDLMGTMSRMNAGWMRTKRNGADVFDISALTGGNKDFHRLIYSGVSYFVSDATKGAGHAGSVGNSAIAGNMIGAFDRANTRDGAAVYGVYGLAGFYDRQTPAAAVRKHFPKVAMSGTYDLTIAKPRTNSSSTNSNRANTTDARLLNHLIATIF